MLDREHARARTDYLCVCVRAERSERGDADDPGASAAQSCAEQRRAAQSAPDLQASRGQKELLLRRRNSGAAGARILFHRCDNKALEIKASEIVGRREGPLLLQGQVYN
ncbi:hypothetical protein FQA47_005988 [Oryzias melastigma]|uniref:Uncharacterized protein n=1 Tax=Oryzias melastigma TaxID=30732 RepID=A0A834F791_ORYME|nr:hypothetical protein FQA47_005988 [Oryzias melastigma]